MKTTTKPQVEKLALTILEAAAALSLSRSSMYRLCKKGVFRPSSLTGRNRVISMDQILAALNK